MTFENLMMPETGRFTSDSNAEKMHEDAEHSGEQVLVMLPIDKLPIIMRIMKMMNAGELGVLDGPSVYGQRAGNNKYVTGGSEAGSMATFGTMVG